MSKQSDIVKVSQDAGTTGFVNTTGDTMTGTLLAGNVARNVDGIRIQSNQSGTSYGLRIGSDGSTDPLEFWREHSNGDQKQFSVDYFGRVTLPYQPAFNATALSSEVLGTGWRVISYNQEVSQRGNSYNAATSTFTAPVSGWYQFNASWSAESNGDVDGTFALGLNGDANANFGTVSMPQTGENYSGHSVSACTYLAANDYVRVYSYSVVQTTTRGYAWTGNFSGYLLG